MSQRWHRIVVEERVKIMGMVQDDAGRLFEVFEEELREVPVIASAGASKTFRSYDQHQSFLLPPSLDEWLPVPSRAHSAAAEKSA